MTENYLQCIGIQYLLLFVWLKIDTDDATERLVQANDNGAKKSTESETGPGFVYIIKMVGTDKVKPPEFIKVGKTSNLVKRRSDLNGGNPFHLAYVAAWKVTDMKDGEKRAHAYLNSFKLSVKPYFNGGSEWFSLPPATPSHSGLEEVHDNIEYFLGDKNYEGGNLLVPNDPGNIVATDKSLQQYWRFLHKQTQEKT